MTWKMNGKKNKKEMKKKINTVYYVLPLSNSPESCWELSRKGGLDFSVSFFLCSCSNRFRNLVAFRILKEDKVLLSWYNWGTIRDSFLVTDLKGKKEKHFFKNLKKKGSCQLTTAFGSNRRITRCLGCKSHNVTIPWI